MLYLSRGFVATTFAIIKEEKDIPVEGCGRRDGQRRVKDSVLLQYAGN